ncbi:MAG: DUF3426 domain-containing protein, partial [Burkholderiaceae bacterium]
RCNEVFSALEGLFDMERESAPEWLPNSPDLEVQPESPTEHGSDPTAPVDAGEVDAAAGWASAEATPLNTAGPTDLTDLTIADDHFRPEAPADESSEASAYADDALQTEHERPTELATLLHRADDTHVDADVHPHADVVPDDAVPSGNETVFLPPAFVRHAQRRAMWHSPRVRGALLAASLVLLLALGLQGMHHFRDAIAANRPAWRPVLAGWCGALSCLIEPARRIDAVTVESSALTRAPVADAFNLSVVLRNRGTTAIALPAVDLNLTDANGQLVARKVLLPRDFKMSSEPMAAGADAVLQLALAVDGAQVSGYTVEIFYP